MNKKYDVIIVGTGVAGLFCALTFSGATKILMITKKAAEESDSFLAQGGICVLRGEEDYEAFFQDTMAAGHHENNKNSLELMLRSSHHVIGRLLDYGVSFQKDAEGGFSYTKEGAHSTPRILYHADITGKEITSKLLQRVRERNNITIKENTTMIDLVMAEDVCKGIVAADFEGRVTQYAAPSVVLATGGIGGLYKNSTNFSHLTGDGIAVAIRHKVKVELLDYVQIHPTTLYSEKHGRRFLISESVRGEGGKLYGSDGKRFADELLPRDRLSVEIMKKMEKDGSDYVYLDMRPIGEKTILEHFPNIYSRCLEEGFDVLKERIPVVPAQHYHMGGVATNLSGRTDKKGLYAVGEVASTGVHGKNRLASNSLLEALVFAERAAYDMMFREKTGEPEAEITDPDIRGYENLQTLFKSYKNMILDEMEKE